MLFFIDKSLAQSISNSDADVDISDIVSAIELIAHARRTGKHLVIGDRDTIKVLKEWQAITDSARSVYKKIYEQLPQMKAYLDGFSMYACVVNSRDDCYLERLNGGKGVIKISAKLLGNISLLAETILLCENQDDAKMYGFIAQYYLQNSHLGQIVLRYEPRGGGGNTISQEYCSIQERAERFCLCILDSDYKFDGARIGDTANAVREKDNANQPLCSFVILSVREIENIIPTSIYREVSQNDPNRTRAMQGLEKIEQSRFSEARKYLDLKRGHKLFDFSPPRPDCPDYMYWKRIFTEIGTITKCSAASCCNKKEDCTCFVFHGFGNNILRSIIKYVEKSPPICDVDPATMQEWISLGKTILDWCCGATQLSAT